MDHDENNHQEDPGLETWIDPAWETRIVALLQGEASDFESEDLEKQLRENPELRVFHRRMLAVHGLLGETLGSDKADAGPMTLSPERREAVLERIRGKVPVDEAEKPKGPKPMKIVEVECPKAAEQRRRKAWAWAMTSAAAVFVSLFMMAGLLFRRAGSEFKASSMMDTSISSPEEADYGDASLSRKSEFFAKSAGQKPLAPAPTNRPASSVMSDSKADPVSLATTGLATDPPQPATLNGTPGNGFADDGAQVAQFFDSHLGNEVTRYAIPDKPSGEVSDRLFAEMDGKASGEAKSVSGPESAPVPEAEELPLAGRLFRQNEEGRGVASDEGRFELTSPTEVSDGREKDAVVSLESGRGGRDRRARLGAGGPRFNWASQPGAVTTYRTKEREAETKESALARHQLDSLERQKSESVETDDYRVDLNDTAAEVDAEMLSLQLPMADPKSMNGDGGDSPESDVSGKAMALLRGSARQGELSAPENALSSPSVVENDHASASQWKANRDGLKELGQDYSALGDLDKAAQSYHEALEVDGTDVEARKGQEQVEEARLAYQRSARDQTRGKMLKEVDQLWEMEVPAPTLNDEIAAKVPEEKNAETPPASAAPEMAGASVAPSQAQRQDFGLDSGPEAPRGWAGEIVDGGVRSQNSGAAGAPATEDLKANLEALAATSEEADKWSMEQGNVAGGKMETGGFGGASSGGLVAGGGGMPEDETVTDNRESIDSGGEVAERTTALSSGRRSGVAATQTADIDGLLNERQLKETEASELAQLEASKQGQGLQTETRFGRPQRDDGIVEEIALQQAASDDTVAAVLSDVPKVVEFEGFANYGEPIVEREFLGGANNLRGFGYAEVPQSGPEMPSAETASVAESEFVAGREIAEGEVARRFETGLDIAGKNLTRDRVIRRELGVSPGEDFIADQSGDVETTRWFGSGGTPGGSSSDSSNWAFFAPEVGGGNGLSDSQFEIEVGSGFLNPTEYDPPEIPQDVAAFDNGSGLAFPVTPSSPTSFESDLGTVATANFAKGFLGAETLSVPGEGNGRLSELGDESVASLGKKSTGTKKGKELESLKKEIAEVPADEPAKPSEPVAESKPAPDPVVEPVAPLEAQPEIETSVEPVSTFSLHVSDVSFKLAEAALLEKGEWPEAGKMRIEEFVNAFDYGDPSPSPDEAVACRTEQAAHPFLPQRNILRVAMKTGATGRSSSQPLRLTVLLDKSGSMERADREASVQRAMEALASHLSANDAVTLIGFARQPRLIADRLSGERANELAGMVERAPSEGGTNLEEALKLAAAKAKEQFIAGGQNRIVLLTDGAANLGNARPESLGEMVVNLRQQGIAFDACGVGADGLNDAILEALTRQGDGRYYFLNRPSDADESFVRQLAGALRPAAKNVKVQVIFNPERVTSYRLLGFEKHLLKKEDFRNDAVDAAEMAAAEAGVGLYEMAVNPSGQGDVGEVFVRFQDMATGEMVERSWTIPYEAGAPALDAATPSMQLAGTAAYLGMKLRGGPDAGMVRFDEFGKVTNGLRSYYAGSERVKHLLEMVEKVRGGE